MSNRARITTWRGGGGCLAGSVEQEANTNRWYGLGNDTKQDRLSTEPAKQQQTTATASEPSKPLPQQPSLDSACRLVFETDINKPPHSLSFPVYANCPPKQSATVPIPNCVKAPGYFSPDIPGCFVTHFCGGFRKTDVVKLGDVGLWQVVVEGVEEFGRDFV